MIPIRVPQVLASMALSLALPMGIGCGPGPAPQGPPGADRGVDPDVVGPGEGAQADSGIDEATTFPRLPGMAEPLTDEELEAMGAQDLVDRARETYDPDEQIRMLDVAVRKDPESRDALLRLVDAVERKGIQLALTERRREESKPFLDRAAALARTLRDREEPLVGQERLLVSMALYNEACNLALDGKPDQAMASLREAIELDFSDPIIFTDEELDTLRDREDFKELLKRVPEPTGPIPGPAPASP